MQKDYNIEMQTLFLRMMVTDAELYTRVMNIMNPQNFDRKIRSVAEFIVDHTTKFSSMPEPNQIQAQCGILIEPIPELDTGHHDWFLEEFESFTRRQELERAILKSADLLEKGEYDPVEKLIKDAVQISLQRDMGTDYFADPRARLIALKTNNGQNSTGWPTMDRKLYGGFNRGELQIFAGGSGSGKSLFLQNLAVNWAQLGLNGAYITLELNEGLCSMRIDAMMTSIGTRDIFKNLDNVELRVKMMAKKSGNLRIKYMPAQSTVNDIRAYCKELQIQTGMKLDFLCVDYLDLLMPVSIKISPSDLFVKDKFVSEELRNLSKELNLLFATASQLNRSAVEEIEFDHSHIGGGISKINTADNVFGIFTSRAMRERGIYQLQLMKTRSSSGVGQKIELEFNVETLRITDPDPEGTGQVIVNPTSLSGSTHTNSIMEKLKAQSTLVTTDPAPLTEGGEPVVTVQGSKLKAMLSSLNSTAIKE